jgi:hypothetical protein
VVTKFYVNTSFPNFPITINEIEEQFIVLMHDEREKNTLEAIERIIFTDQGQRGLENLWTPGCLGQILGRLDICDKRRPSYVLTGFCLSKTSETDGPLGSAVLCSTLRSLGYNSGLLCDSASSPVVIAAAASGCPVFVTDNPTSIENPEFIISVERPGRSRKTNEYRTMRALALPNVAPLDLLFPSPNDPKPYLTIGVGDGGNEVGTGNIADSVARFVPFGDDICTSVCCDVLVMAGVSNWGALAIAAALAIDAKRVEIGSKFIEICSKQEQMLKAMLQAGAYDGRTGKAEESIDGMLFAVEHMAVTDAICDAVRQYYGLVVQNH